MLFNCTFIILFQLFEDRWYFLSLYDGVCDQTKELKILRGSMPEDNKWVISSSGHNMFVRFSIGSFLPNVSPGFSAKIHFGNQINVIVSIYDTYHLL